VINFFLRSGLAAGSLFFLASCAYSVRPESVPVPQETARRSLVSGSVPEVIRGVDLNLGAVSVSGSGFLDMAPMPLCDAAAVILGDSLKVPHSCSGVGTVALVHPSDDPLSLLALFVATVERLGGAVVFANGSATVTGLVDQGEAAGVQGAPLEGVQGAEPVAGLDAFTVSATGDFDQLRQVASFGRSGLARRASGYASAEEVQLAADDMGLSLRAVALRGSVFVVGDETALRTWDMLNESLGPAVVPVAAPGLSEPVLAAYRSAYPQVGMDLDPASGTVFVSGYAEDVAGAVAGLRETQPADSRVRINGLFFSYSSGSLKALQTDLQLDGLGGDLLDGSSVGLPFSVVVDQVESSDFVQVVARPSLTATLGVPAEFRSGGEVPVVGSVDLETGAETITYREVGLSMRATAAPLLGGLVRVALVVELANVEGTGVRNNPSFETRSVSTSVDLRRGDTVMLSGLAEMTRASSRGRSFGLPSFAGRQEDRQLGLFVTLE